MADTVTSAPWRESLRDILAGTVAGIVGRFLEYPFDTIKVKLQAASVGSRTHYKGPWDCFLTTLRKEGVHGLYRGMAMPLGATIVETSTLFFANGYLKRVLSEKGHISPGDELPMSMVFLAGAGTGLVVSFVLTPIELVKCRLQVDESHGVGAGGSTTKYRGPIDCLLKSIQREGLPVVYRGHVATMLREIPGTACWFGAYEAFARWMTPAGHTRQDLPSSVIIAAGALGGMSYWAVMYPCDTVKSAMQIAETPSVQEAAPKPPSGAPAAPAVRSSPGILSSVLAGKQSILETLAGTSPKLSMFSTFSGAPSTAASAVANAALSHARKLSTSVVPQAPTFLGTFAQIYRSGGARALYAGFLPTIIRAAPSNAAIFIGYEWSNAWLKQYL